MTALRCGDPPEGAEPGRSQRYDVEYHLRGIANVFMFTEPLGGWRRASATRHRKKLDWAEQIRILLEQDYPDAEVVVLVMDNLNTHNVVRSMRLFCPGSGKSASPAVGNLLYPQTW